MVPILCNCFRRSRFFSWIASRKGPTRFRPPRDEEQPILRRIWDEAFEGESLDVSDFEKAWETRDPTLSTVITTPCDDIIGFALIDSSGPQAAVQVSQLAVGADWRKGGQGSVLLRQLIQRSVASRCTIYLSPLDHEPLKKWQMKHGLSWTHFDFLKFHPYETRSHAKELAEQRD